MIVYLGLGSNLGRREAYLQLAVQLLEKREVCPLRASSLYETVPWGYTEQESFLNGVLEVETALLPQPLLAAITSVEKEVGRTSTFRWGPRVLDIDIVLYGDKIINELDLQIPHARMHERAFVLVPLAELTSELVHPTFGVTIGALLQKVGGAEGVKKTEFSLSLSPKI